MRLAVVFVWLLGGCGEEQTVEGYESWECYDGVDNDGNGLADCQDYGCSAAVPCMKVPEAEMTGWTHETGLTGGWGTDETGVTGAAGTDETDSDPGTGGTTASERPALTQADVACEGDHSWVLTAQTAGLTSGGIVNMWETKGEFGWDEEHTIADVYTSPFGLTQDLERRLESGAPWESFAPDLNTVFNCGIHDDGDVMTYMFRVYDTAGALADCWLFSTHPEGVDEVLSGEAPSNNPMTDPGDLEGCQVL